MIIIGHRGAKGHEPENTLSSFKTAIALGVDMIELDVYTVRTGEVVVIHDATVDRTTDGRGPVADYTFTELRALDAGDGERIPLLTEVLDLVDRRIPINIELKGTGTAQAVTKIIRDYVHNRGWRHDLFVVSSFNHEELQTFVHLSPKTPTSTLLKHVPASYWRIAQGDSVVSTNVEADQINRLTVLRAHRHGVKLYAYTVNNSREAARLRRMKVDGIFSDFPDRVSLPKHVSLRSRLAARRAHLLPLSDTVSLYHQ